MFNDILSSEQSYVLPQISFAVGLTCGGRLGHKVLSVFVISY